MATRVWDPTECYWGDDTPASNGDGLSSDEFITNGVHVPYKSEGNVTISTSVPAEDINGTGYTKCSVDGKS